MLNTRSTFDSESRCGSSLLASSGTTSWPSDSIALRIASMVSGGSYSASASLPSLESTRFMLKVKPTRSFSGFLRGGASGVCSPQRTAADFTTRSMVWS